MNEQNKFIFGLLFCFAFFFILDSATHREPAVLPSMMNERASFNPNNNHPQSDQINTKAANDKVSSFDPSVVFSRDIALQQSKRIPIKTPFLSGSLNLKGCLLDDLTLNAYKETTDPNSSNVVLLSPRDTKNAYVISIKYKSPTNSDIHIGYDTEWVLDEKSPSILTPKTPITLVSKVFDNVVLIRKISVDEQYVFTIEDKFENSTTEVLNIQPIASITRRGKPETGGFYVLHEGGVGVLDHKLKEISYDDMEKEKLIQQDAKEGWHGFTDKYWLTAIIPAKDRSTTAVYKVDQHNVYKTQSIESNLIIPSKNQVTVKHQFYTGAKVLKILESYEKNQKFDRFHLAVDFGWFYFLTKPLFYLLDYMNKILGNMGLAILALTVLFKILTFPLAHKSQKSMAKMKAVQPKMEKLKALYGDDKIRFNQALMELYKKEKVNPVSGCLPMLLQAPIFFCLYKVFFVTIEMRHAPFFGWIHDLAAPDPTTIFNLFGLVAFNPPSFLMIGAWPLLMGLTMLLQQKMSPQPTDPQQAKVMMIMPLMFTYMFASFPAGLVIYWAWSNILTILQQWSMTRFYEQTETLPSNSKKLSKS